ncbi:MAG: hypothetical protein ACR2PG_05190 [Hyphomicrobiaceae bacterium]
MKLLVVLRLVQYETGRAKVSAFGVGRFRLAEGMLGCFVCHCAALAKAFSKRVARGPGNINSHGVARDGDDKAG